MELYLYWGLQCVRKILGNWATVPYIMNRDTQQVIQNLFNYKVYITAKITVISSNFLVWKFYGKTQFPHSFERIAQQNFHPRKSDEFTVFFPVYLMKFYCNLMPSEGSIVPVYLGHLDYLGETIPHSPKSLGKIHRKQHFYIE